MPSMIGLFGVQKGELQHRNVSIKHMITVDKLWQQNMHDFFFFRVCGTSNDYD